MCGSTWRCEVNPVYMVECQAWDSKLLQQPDIDSKSIESKYTESNSKTVLNVPTSFQMHIHIKYISAAERPVTAPGAGGEVE